PRVDVDGRCAAALRLHGPTEPHRVAFGEVRALDDDAVGVRQVLLERGGAAPSERDPQTGDRGAVSYAGLVLHLNDPGGRGELADEVVLLIVQGGPAQEGDPKGPSKRVAFVVLGLPCPLAHALV